MVGGKNWSEDLKKKNSWFLMVRFLYEMSFFVVGYIAYTTVTAEQINEVIPVGWKDLTFGWYLNLDWSSTDFPAVNNKIEQDGFGLFGVLFMMLLFKGIFASIAGPVPSYDMQRVLSARTPPEAATMSFTTIWILYIPRYLMVAGFAVLGLVYLAPELGVMGSNIDFEQVFSLAINEFIPSGFKGLLLAGFLAAFMGAFSAFINSAPAYVVNDIYKKYIVSSISDKKYVRMSFISSIVLVVGVIFGFNAASLNELTLWITLVFFGGYVAANMLKWIWWRFNGYGCFYGMLLGLIASIIKLFFFPDIVDVYVFPVVFAFLLLGCLLGTYIYPEENCEPVKNYYKKTRPWGFWGGIKKEVMAEDPSFIPNQNFKRDGINILSGIVWQLAQTVIPIYFILRENYYLLGWSIILVLTTWFLKKNWWDRLKEEGDPTEPTQNVINFEINNLI